MLTNTKEHNLIVRCIIGFIQGIYFYLLTELLKRHIFAGANEAYIFLPQFLLCAFVPLLLMQGYGNMRLQTLIKWGLTSAAITLGLGYYAVYRQLYPGQTDFSPNLTSPSPELIVSLLISFFIAQSLILSSESDHKFRANYHTYFDLSWKLAIQAITTWIFAGIFWGILFLGAGLFNIIHFSFFSKLIVKPWFAFPATTLAIAVGIHSTDVNVRIIQGIRSMNLILLSWLLPLFTAIITLFLACLIFTGLAPLWETKFAGGLLIGTAIVLILLINAAFQDGNRLLSAGRIQQFTANLACYLLLPLTVLAMYALSLRVAQHGWSVNRISAACIMLILLSYSIGYLLAALFSKKNLSMIEGWNFATALFILAISFAYFTPLADPARLMVNNQIARLNAGVVTPQNFDFDTIRFKGLRYGYTALVDLQTSWQGTDKDYVSKTIKEALLKKQSSSDYTTYKTASDYKRDVTVRTPNTALPDSFMQQKCADLYDQNIPSCMRFKTSKCDAWILKDKNNIPMIVISEWSDFSAFQLNSDGTWVITGKWHMPTSCNSKITNAAKKGDVKFTAPEPQGQDMVVGGIRLPFMSSANCK